jgi:hypothetical protein
MSRKIPGVLSREELVAVQLKAKERGIQMRLKIEKEMVEKEKGLFWRVPEYTERTSTKFEYRETSGETSDGMGNSRREKFEIITTTTWRHNGDERYVVFKTEERERKLKIFKSDEKHFNKSACIRIQKYHPVDAVIDPYLGSEKEQLALAKFGKCGGQSDAHGDLPESESALRGSSQRSDGGGQSGH